MDSSGATYVDNGHGYLEINNTVATPDLLFNGDDTTINQVAFGDGFLDVSDVYVTFRRSLDPSLVYFRRFWTNGVRAAEITTNEFRSKIARPRALISSGSPSQSQVNFVAGDLQASAGQTVQIPITAQIFSTYPLRVLMLNLSVQPLDGSPALTAPVSFAPNPAFGSADADHFHRQRQLLGRLAQQHHHWVDEQCGYRNIDRDRPPRRRQ